MKWRLHLRRYQNGYISTKTTAPSSSTKRGTGQSLRYANWEQIAQELSDYGVTKEELDRAKSALDSDGSYVLTELTLPDEQSA